MDFGAGVDMSGQIFGDAVVRSEAVEVPGTGGKTEDIFLTLVSSQEEQDSALNLSTSLCASYGMFGGSGKFDLSQKMHVNRYCISLVIRATVFNSFTQMRDVHFGKSALDLLETGDDRRFREQFGDMYVRGIQKGGELCIVLHIFGEDESEQTEIQSDLEAAGILGGVALSTNDSFSSAVRKATSHHKTILHHFQVGGVPKASIDPDTIIQHALSFAAEVKDGQSESFQALLVPYKTLDAPVAANFVDLENAKETLTVLMQKRRDAMTRLASFNFVVANPDQFIIPPTMNVNAIVGGFDTSIAALTAAASRCVNRPKEATDALAGTAGLVIPLDDLPARRRVDKNVEDILADKGATMVNEDPLAMALRDKEPQGPSQRGFNIAFGADGEGTAPGPGKDKLRNSLAPEEQGGFDTAVSYFIMRNSNFEFATKGAVIAKRDKRVADDHAQEKTANPFFALGFNIATGIFGDPALGGQGDTNAVPGPGQTRIHNSLNNPAQRGFDASKNLHLGPPPLPRGVQN
jgi:hypothetical protein